MSSYDQTETPDEFEELEEFEEDPGHDAILFAIGNEYLAIPLEEIAEIHELEDITPLPMAPPFIE
jgi:chemotaxis signal transduction protein